ncbi:FAD-binding oxidoreductase [Bailinhaonella thermotolerans]|uniref:FAD-binding oxidoreductase n=1 Tax=Bailinhaonella thermotolerans TaxID=1070861 RepID=UPI00192A2A64|nr:FAD-binding oxidoreductase [Bailinhaonella thermotolerans]
MIRPGDAAYSQARRLHMPRFDGRRPAGIAYCANPDDVRECVEFARRHAVPPALRSGGHGYAGWSTGPGLVIDVSALDRVRYDAASGLAEVGAGTRLVDMYARLARDGVSVPGGTCPTVGIAGLALGGGIGVMSRKYGLTCDTIREVRIVTADGRLVTADARRHPDLYWASRGGGGGNFGVVVSFLFQAHRTQDVTMFRVWWPWRRAAAVLRAWQEWGPGAPAELWSNVQLYGPPTIEVMGVFLGDAADLDRHLDRLEARVGAEPAGRVARRRSYQETMMSVAECSSMTVEQCHRRGTLPGTTPSGRWPRADYTAKSHFATRPLPAPAVHDLVRRVDGRGRSVILDALGGAVSGVPAGATAFPHRSALFSLQYLSSPGDRPWLRAVHRAMDRHLGPRAYVNYTDPELRDWQRAYHGPNLPRLRRVKSAYDPARLFDFPQAIPPA